MSNAMQTGSLHTSAKSAVLLLAHGSPDSPAGIPQFLLNITGGRPLPEPVVQEVTKRYAAIGGCSPLNRITMRQAELLAAELGLPVYVGMRNWAPYIAEAVAAMQRDGIEHAVAICLAPQNSRTSVGLYSKALSASAKAALGSADGAPHSNYSIEFAFVSAWHDHPLLIRALAERLRQSWPAACGAAGRSIPVIFTAHSVPQHTITAGDPYEQQARETAQLVASSVSELGDGWRVAFQSQGMAGGPWLGPTVEQTILELKAAGHSAVFLQPVGFVADHVEVLYDIDIGFREFCAAQGMRLWRAPSLNDSPALVAALADIARANMRVMPPA